MTPFEIGVQYHVNCELYDRSVCSGFGKDGAVPVNSWERGKVEANAISERSKAIRDAEIPGIEMDKIIRNEQVINEAIRRVNNPSNNQPIGEFKL